MSTDKRKTAPTAEGRLEELRQRALAECARAGLDDKPPVFGEGPAPCPVMIIGEAPGRDETREGRPFVGRSGRFLRGVLEEVFSGEGGRTGSGDCFYITNVVKVWPTVPTKRLRTRPPSREEFDLFHGFLVTEVEVVRPRVIVAVGKTAMKAVLPEGVFASGAWAGPAENLPGEPEIMPVYHPSYLLRFRKKLEENRAVLKEALAKARDRGRDA